MVAVSLGAVMGMVDASPIPSAELNLRQRNVRAVDRMAAKWHIQVTRRAGTGPTWSASPRSCAGWM